MSTSAATTSGGGLGASGAGTLSVSYFNDTPVYNLSAGRSTPQFLQEAAKQNKSLRYNEEFRNRVELLQDFEFEQGASGRVRCSKDGRYICATGGYPWEMKMFDVEDLGMKFCRRVDHEILDFVFLSDDYRKLAFLQSDRTIEFHAQYGLHHKLRVPKFCRSLAYEISQCVLLAAGSSAEVYRIDLEQGSFLTPLESEYGLDNVNQLCLSPRMPLLAVAGSALSSTSSEDAPSKRSSKKSKKADEKNGEDDGPVALVELWDLRGEGRSVGVLELPGGATAATAIEFSPSGMHLCVGDDRGVVRVYDIRSRRPLAERCHNNELPIKAVKYFQASNGGVVNAAAAIHQSNSTTAGEQEVRSEDVGIDESQLGLGASVLPGPSASSSTSSANKTSILDEQDRTNSSVSLGVGQSGSNSYVIASCDARCVKLWDYSQGAQNSFSSSSSRGPSNTATCTTTTAGGGALLQQTSSRLVAAFESAEAVLNDICFFPNSSLLFAAQDEPRVGSYFLPTLGPAPSWCGFLDSMTQELAETVSKHIYEEHTFLSKQQVHDLRAEELLGTKFLLPFHHGFLMQISIFEKFKRALEEERPRASQSGGGKNSAAGLFDFEERLAAKRQELAAAKRPMRVPAPDKAASGTTARVQANQALFDKLSEKVEQAGEVLRQKKKARGTSSTTQQLQEQLSDKTATSCKLSSGGLVEPEGVQLPESNQKRLLADDRFAKLFSNPEFEIEEAEIRAHDVGTKKRRKAK